MSGLVYKYIFIYRCGTLKLASSKFTILNKPSPKISPLASTIIGVSVFPFHLRHQRLIKPPMVRARVNDGVLYMPAYVSICSSRR